MSGPALDYTYRYARPSSLEWADGGPALLLATSGGAAEYPHFFRGRLLAPRRTADLLLALVHVVHSRFHVPPAMLARILALADPVVTSGGGRLRFEGFSACCSAYARVDLLPEAVDGEIVGRGTTNVDFNPPMRAALTRLRDAEPAQLSVGLGEVELATRSGAVTERKVPLPSRWLKGFVEVQSHQAAMDLCLEVSGSEARRFLRALPRQATKGSSWVVASGAGLRVSQVAARGGIRVGGLERLRILEDIARYAVKLRAYQAPGGEACGWEVVTPDARFHLVLSPEVWRGFSGEGQVLSQLAEERHAEALARVRGALDWQARLDVGEMTSAGLDPAAVRRALAQLGAAGLVGYDLAEGAYFHRELPFDLSVVEQLQPRLRDARKLVAEAAVRIERQNAEGIIEAWVRGTDVEHRVRLDGEGARCTCPWYSKHPGDRGPCKHILAVQLISGGSEEA